jgi:hypothetical protein
MAYAAPRQGEVNALRQGARELLFPKKGSDPFLAEIAEGKGV